MRDETAWGQMAQGKAVNVSLRGARALIFLVLLREVKWDHSRMGRRLTGSMAQGPGADQTQ